MRARLKVSRAGVELIKSFEGLRQTAARLPDGRWTLGYGHTFSARDGAKVTPEDAEALLRFDLLPIVDGLNNNIVVPLSQHQFDALVSFCFNIGLENFVSSNVLKRINEGRLMEAALAMESWRSAEFGGQTYVLAPLIRRRAAEKNLFLTPVENDNTAPSMLVRPMEDPRLGQGNPSSRPAELYEPLQGNQLQARPYGEPEVKAPAPVYDAPVQAAPVAPAPTYGSDRSYIDLSASSAIPTEAPRAKPVIVRVADVGPETSVAPVAAPAVTPAFTPTTFSPDAEPVMSPAVRAALEQAQAEADARSRAEEQRRADEVRLAEETRLRETRLAEEAQRQAQALAAARAEQEARQAAFRIEEDRRRQEEEGRREEEERQRAARLEEEKARQAQAEEALRLEAQRQEDQRRETEARLQAEAQKQAELAAAAAAAAVVVVETPAPVAEIPVETKAVETPAPKTDAPAAPADDAKRNEAMANLMRFYSPYGASPMGKPLGSLRPAQPAATTPAPAPIAPAPATQSTPSAMVAPPSAAQSTPVSAPIAAPSPVSSTPVYPAYPPAKPSESSVAAAPGLMIDTQEPTILSPSALVPPAVFAATPQSAPRPVETPLEIARTNPARQAAAEAQVSWREKLDRPVPGEFPKAVTPAPAPQAAPYHSPSKVYDATASDDDELWDDEAARIAMMADDHEDDHPSFMAMISSSIGWLVTSTLGIISLGGAAAAFYKSNDPGVVRAGEWADFFQHSAVVLAVIGLVLICSSIAMILKRLGGLKE